MKTIAALMSFFILLAGCEENLNSDVNSRISLIKERLEYITRQVNQENVELSDKFYYISLKLDGMVKKITQSVKDHQIINFDQESTFFKKDNSIKTDFWKKKGDLKIEEAILLLENLCFEIEKSDYCNDFYIANSIKIMFDDKNSTFQIGKTDSVRFIFSASNENFLPEYRLDNNNQIFNSHYLKLNVAKKGFYSVKGQVRVLKQNKFVFIPFNYDYVVR